MKPNIMTKHGVVMQIPNPSIRKAEVSEVVKYLPFAEWQSFEVLPRRDRPELFEVS